MQADERRQCQNRHFPAATGVMQVQVQVQVQVSVLTHY